VDGTTSPIYYIKIDDKVVNYLESIKFNWTTTSNFKAKVQEETDFEIVSEKVYFYGTCKECKDAQSL
jgi:Fe2+ or Zn2+ uptake regulation protein